MYVEIASLVLITKFPTDWLSLTFLGEAETAIMLDIKPQV